MASQYGFQRIVEIGNTNKEGTYDSAASGTYHKYYVSSDAFNQEVELVDNVDTVTGYEESTGQEMVAKSTSGTLEFPRIRPHDLATVAAYAMGDSSTAADTASVDLSGGWQHKLRIPATSGSTCGIPSLTLREQLITGIVTQYSGMMVDSFTLSVEKKGWFSLSSNLIGSGTRTDGSTLTGTDLTGEPFLKAGDAKLFFASSATGIDDAMSLGAENLTGTPVEVSGITQSFEWSYNNNIDGDYLYQFDGDLVRKRAERTRRNQTVSFSVELVDGDESARWLHLLEEGTAIGFEVDCKATQIGSGGYYGFDLAFPKIRLTSANVTGGLDRLVVNCEGVVLDSEDATDKSVALDVVNNVEARYAQ